ncbi:glycine--tRNA ligase subunit beta, partial [Streptomyces sp. NPDC096934]|uniref:glycine--tRNA ligase subunit beta n=1 Tax=Streptomyces sp. NPDC096934 TaxID=3155551 RepID=UPI003320156C
MPGLPSSELGLDTPAPGTHASVPHLPLGSRCITCPNGIDRPHADHCSHTAEALQPIRHCSIIEKPSSTPAGPGPAGCDVFALAASAGSPYFITVRNGDHNHLEKVAKGNEKVLRARLAD